MHRQALADEHKTQHSQRQPSHLSVDLYGVSPNGLAVFQVREGTWDSKYGFGKIHKRYLLLDSHDYVLDTPFGKVRGAIRANPEAPWAAVAGALWDALAMRPREAERLAQSREVVRLKALHWACDEAV